VRVATKLHDEGVPVVLVLDEPLVDVVDATLPLVEVDALPLVDDEVVLDPDVVAEHALQFEVRIDAEIPVGTC